MDTFSWFVNLLSGRRKVPRPPSNWEPYDQRSRHARREGGEPAVKWPPASASHLKSPGNCRSVARARRSSRDAARPVNQLRDAGAGDAEDREAILRGADRRDARMQFVLGAAPVHDVHGWNDKRLGTESHEAVGHPGVAQIVAYADPDLPPRRVPQLLFRRRQSVFEELDRHSLDLAEHDVAARPDDISSVVEVGARGRVLAADDQVTPALPAPLSDLGWHGAVKGVFAEHNQFGFRVRADNIVQPQRYLGLAGELHLNTGDADGGNGLSRRLFATKEPAEADTPDAETEQAQRLHPGLLPQECSSRGNAHQQEADTVSSHEFQRALPRSSGKGIADVEPGKAQVVKLTAEVFEASPDKWNEQPTPSRAEPPQAQSPQPHEQGYPEGIDAPQRSRPAQKYPPEERQPNYSDQKPDRESRIERLAPLIRARQLQQGVEIQDNQGAGVSGRVSRVKSSRRNQDPEEDACNWWHR